MGLYNNRIVVKVGTSTLTNDAGKVISERQTDWSAYFLISRIWDMKLFSFLRVRSPSDGTN